MQFSEALQRITTVLESVGSDISGMEYDGIIVKKLEASNTLDRGRSTNQTHIAITGQQMDIFPYIRADGYFATKYADKDDDLKRYFVAQIPIYLHKENVLYLDSEAKLFDDAEKLVYTSIVRSRRDNAADQIQMSMTNLDTHVFIEYRKVVHAKSYMVLLKRKQQLIYDLYSVKEADGESELHTLNNEFYKASTITPVKLDEITTSGHTRAKKEELPFEQSKNCARKIIEIIYKIDTFSRIMDCLEDKEKSIKIRNEEVNGNYLSHVFAKSTSDVYKNPEQGRIRVFDDKEYYIHINGQTTECRLSTEWVSADLGTGGDSNNYLLALIKLINKKYVDYLKIFQEGGKWYLEYLKHDFSANDLPDVFRTEEPSRFITSLLAKPFVILTGNSGTGKTRIAKQFAQYLEVKDENEEKNWLIVPVGADWTDNSKVIGFFNPLAEEGKGKYVKTDILELIERANAHPDIPYFLILDEMNLSHVERYFSDFLSHMETLDVPFEIDGYGILDYPENLFVVGTVNIDETTYMFSPKVLDRANVIEFKPSKEDVLNKFDGSAHLDSVPRASVGTAQGFLCLAREIRADDNGADNQVAEIFGQIYDIAEKKGFEFAYRTVKEIRLYIDAAHRLSDKWEEEEIYRAIDEQLLQKVLPKIHGNRKEIGEMLDELSAVCDQEGKKLERSLKKIEQMKGKLASVQYASFI